MEPQETVVQAAFLNGRAIARRRRPENHRENTAPFPGGHGHGRGPSNDLAGKDKEDNSPLASFERRQAKAPPPSLRLGGLDKRVTERKATAGSESGCDETSFKRTGRERTDRDETGRDETDFKENGWDAASCYEKNL
ncbi:hypothetical protein L6452_22133 [Arctium lappa]|uniref:Uncharacterized protein n=1 Tax=Arctium lappa TaxID=4217 RepID=A0ACB9AZQ9_ARCLA|nr:hypothetical protein L6452_22133 [Arctium lappa]